MATFEVPVKRIKAIEPHPDADKIEIAVIDGYRSIIKKNQYKQGDLVAYIPEGAVLPVDLLKELGFWNEEKGKGTLNGPEGDRVKAVKLRQQLSQGICYDITYIPAHVVEGDNVAEVLGITKYEPPIPVAMSGEVFSMFPNPLPKFDVENIKSYPDMYVGKTVTVMEKLHGTFCGVAFLPEYMSHPEAFGEKKNILIYSKGLGGKGLFFKNNETNAGNLYVRVVSPLIPEIERHFNAIRKLNDLTEEGERQFTGFLFGEIVGKGVQDLHYVDKPELFLFATGYVYQNYPFYSDYPAIEFTAKEIGCGCVPALAVDTVFHPALIEEFTQGETNLGANHMREGVVFWCHECDSYEDEPLPMLKSVSEAYLLRKNGTEFN